MNIVIVPNDLRDSIYKIVDKELERCPQFILERENIYKDILNYYNENGTIPDFELKESK